MGGVGGGLGLGKPSHASEVALGHATDTSHHQQLDDLARDDELDVALGEDDNLVGLDMAMATT